MTTNIPAGARRVVPRSRGALSGVALIVLGLWGALIPFVGPYFNFSFTPDDAWHWTSARGWLEVLPGAAAFVAGLLLLTTRSRSTTLLAAWLGILAGTWFAVGLQLQDVWHIGSPGAPAGTGSGIRALEALALFPLLGVVVVYFAATAFGRLSVVSVRDTRAAERREKAAAAEAERERQVAAARDRDAAEAREREAAQAATAHERAAAQGRDDRHDDPNRTAERDGTGTAERDPAGAAGGATLADRQQDGTRTRDHRTHDHRTHDHRALGAHSADQEPDRQTYQPQQVDPQQQTYAQQQVDPQQQAYAQQQAYGQQQAYAQQQAYGQRGSDPYAGQPAPASGRPAPSDTRQDSLVRRLFHRR